MLSLEDVSLQIGGKRLFPPLSFALKQGQKVGIVGASGIGKSQLLKAIVGLSKAEVSGHIYYNGKDTCKMSPPSLQEIRGREIGLIGQNPFSQFNPTRKISSQLFEAALVKGASASFLLKKSLFLLEKLAISRPKALLSSYPQELSGGMLQKALITMFLLLEPKVLLTDEPTTALDPLSIACLLRVLKEDTNAACIFVTHNQKAASAFCAQTWSLKKGAWHVT